MHALASAPPPTCTTSRSSGQRRTTTISQPSVSPPSTASPFRLPWQVKGMAPFASASSSARYVGSPAISVPRADLDVRTELLEPREDDRVGVGGHEDAQERPAGRSDDRRRERRVAAARDRQLRPPATRRRGRSAPPTSSCSRTPNRWRALCEPETLPVSSFTQTPPRLREPEARRSGPVLRANGVTDEAVPVDRGDRVVEAAHELAEGSVGEAAGSGEVVRVEQLRYRTNGFGSWSSIGEAEASRGRARAATRGRRRRRDSAFGQRKGYGSPGIRRRRRTRRRRAGSAGRSQRLQDARPGVELVDQVVPAGDDLAQPAPERRGRGGPRSPRARCPAARPRCSSRG